MSDTGKQSPLGVNVNSSTLRNIGFYINPVAAGYMGASRINSEYSFGSIVQNTCLRLLTWSIHDAYNRGVVLKTPAGTSVYDNLITIGKGVIESLGNSKPPTYLIVDPSGRWTAYGGPATTGYGFSGNTDQGQDASWIPYLMTNPNHSVTQWGFVRCWALQAWNEFNWNGGTLYTASATTSVQYKEFTSSFLSAQAHIDFMNVTINSMKKGQTFLKGTYSNMNDLSSADLTGVTLATSTFGQDCITAGKVIDLSKLLSFGLPSVLLQTIKKYNTLTQSLTLALLASGLSNEEIDDISRSATPSVSKEQEQQIYGAFLIVTGSDLQEILIPLNCKTAGLSNLADLLNIKKLFPNSYKSLTVPIYNPNPGPTNSKTYYPIFDGNSVSPRLSSPDIVAVIGTTIIPGNPPVIVPPPPKPVVTETPILVPPVSPTGAGGVGSPTVVASTGSAPVPITPSSGGGGCVVLESYIPVIEEAFHNGNLIKQAYQICAGHKIVLGNETSLDLVNGVVTAALNELQPCVRITTEDGVTLVCSTTAPIPTRDNGVINAPNLLSEDVAVLVNNKPYWSKVVKIEDVGMKFVRAIDTGDNSFWAGEIEGSYILHHNMAINIRADISKN